GGKLAFASGETKAANVLVWDAATGRRLHAFRHAPQCVSVGFRDEGRTLVSSYGETKFWDLETGEARGRARAPNRGDYPSLRPDGRLIAMSNGSDVRLWAVATNREMPLSPPRPPFLTCAALTDDDRLLVTGDNTGFVRLLDAGTGKETRSRQVFQAGVLGLAVAPSGEGAGPSALAGAGRRARGAGGRRGSGLR